MKIKLVSLLNHRGSALLFTVIAITSIAVLGTGIYFMTSTSTFSGISANDQNRAYQLAVAGKEYALVNNADASYNRDYTFSNGDKFRLFISGDTITSTGIVKEGTPYEAKRTVTATITGFSSRSDVSFASDIQSFTAPTQSQTDFITTDTATGEISLGKTTMTQTFGAVWYKGGAAAGNCIDGECDFGKGFNAFFVFQFASGSTGDGFTFAFNNGFNNNSSSVGGYAGWGELLGYAGTSYLSPGNYLDGQGGLGIQPPKVAVEFDVFENDGTESACISGNRYDGSRNHTALMFWGDNATSCGSLNGASSGLYSFDDNRHGSGTDSAADPMNAKSPPQSGWNDCHYFNGNAQCTGADLGWDTKWLLNAPNNVYAVRIEVTRSLTKNASNNYYYEIKTWIEKCASGDLSCTLYDDSSDLANTKEIYPDEGSLKPKLYRKVQLDETHHQAFKTMFFGWTTATGGATLEVKIRRFGINFQ